MYLNYLGDKSPEKKSESLSVCGQERKRERARTHARMWGMSGVCECLYKTVHKCGQQKQGALAALLAKLAMASHEKG